MLCGKKKLNVIVFRNGGRKISIWSKEKTVANKEEEFRRHQVSDVEVCATNKSKQSNQPNEENIHVSQTLRVYGELQDDWRSVNSVLCV